MPSEELEINKRNKNEISREIKKWLEKDLGCNEYEIDDIYKSELAVNFLLVWSRFETRCYGKFIGISKIKDLETKFFYKDEVITLLEEIIREFHERYKDQKKLKKLKNLEKVEDKDSFPMFDEIIKKDYINLDKKEKLILITYTIFRYRNNMFHGNKDIKEWLKFENEIYNCTIAMMHLIDNYIGKSKPKE